MSVKDVYWLARTQADVNTALHVVREAMSGYVAIHADEDHGEPTTREIWDELEGARDRLIAAQNACDRALGDAEQAA